ncbi:type II toxin-antitoxin system HicB family antitoxin [Acinetobacter bereziniae]|uniref:type II toxin-antitoxin system HicB family antitoxin n=1 Tax=Acinetobacter bereziniae TaxID=106648 RepID=UPI001250BF3C|nr:type II toxin-antitoxin system HicB family antitoxin [Acinetobacter bereziniae]MCU4320646.1 type II toxin-antitoxin system HicB family antitoxin [Acinetobacter bereziniae]
MLYPVAIERGDANHAYGVTVPDLVGCYSAGDTLEEAMVNVKEAMKGYLEISNEDGEDIPVGSDIDKYIDNPDYAGYIWAMVDIDITPYLGTAQKVNVTLPNRLLADIDSKVAEKGSLFKTRSALLAEGAKYVLSRSAKDYAST